MPKAYPTPAASKTTCVGASSSTIPRIYSIILISITDFCYGYCTAKPDFISTFLKVQVLAKPKRASSLWSFGLTKSFLKVQVSLTLSAALGIAQASLALRSLARKFSPSQSEQALFK